MKTSIRFTALALLAWLTAPAQADVIMEWSARTDALAIEQRQIPTLHARTLALVHVAMFEAVNAIEPRYQSYRLKLVTDRRTSPELAAAAAAHAMLTALFPAQQALLDSQLAPVVNAVPEGPRRARALLLGRKAAEELLALRAQDGSEIAETWRPATPPGVYIPTTIPLASTVPGYRPWVMSSAAQFRPAPPPALDSETWTRDLAEIREQGGATSSRRTAEQTAIAKFWFLNGPRWICWIARGCTRWCRWRRRIPSSRCSTPSTPSISGARSRPFAMRRPPRGCRWGTRPCIRNIPAPIASALRRWPRCSWDWPGMSSRRSR